MATLEQIKELREKSGAGVSAVKEAIDASKGDMEKAMTYLRQKGVAKGDKRKDKSAMNGVIGVYIHTNNRLVVVCEVNCETDFAAQSPEMVEFANNIALQVAAMNPEYVNVDSIPEKILKTEKEVYEKDVEGKPAEIKEKILEGKLQKFYSEKVLMNQKLFINDKKTVQDYLDELLAKVGEKILVKSFAKFEVAQDISMCEVKSKEEK